MIEIQLRKIAIFLALIFPPVIFVYLVNDPFWDTVFAVVIFFAFCLVVYHIHLKNTTLR